MTQAFGLSADHRVLVVGGAGDIGSAICHSFLEAGASVVATGVDHADLLRTRLRSHSRLSIRTLDITNESEVATLVGELGGLDTLVNCAGIQFRHREYEIEMFKQVLDVNLTGTFRLCAACKPLLERNGAALRSSIVNIASMNAFLALPFLPAYCASKAGVVGLTKSLAVAWAGSGIRVNAIAPGYVETAINETGRRDEAHKARITARIPQGRWALPADISGSAVFLSTPAAQYITGTVLAVDGGFLAN